MKSARTREAFAGKSELAGEIPLCTTDSDGKICSANDVFAGLLGYHREEVVGMQFADFADVAPPQDDQWRSASKTTKGKNSRELVLPRRDGTLLTAMAYVQRITGEDGKPRITWLLTDVSLYSRAALRQQALLDSVALGIFVSADKTILRTNSMADEMFRASPGSLIGKPGSYIFPSHEAYDRLRAAACPVLAKGEKFECELEFKRMNGELFPCYLRAKAVDPLQPELGTVWILEDRTEKKTTEAALREALDEIEAIVNNAMVGMIKVENRRIVWCNRKLEQLLGYEHGELNGQSTRICYESDADWKSVGEVYKELVGGAVHTQERVLRCKDGSLFWCFMSGKALDSQDPIKSAIWLFEDVSWRKEAELELVEARRQAEEATRAKSMFLANMSHEIRTPMNAIIGLSGLMQKMALPPKEQDYVNKIHIAGTTLLRIIDDILDFSKIEAGKLELEHTDFHIDSVLDHVVTLLGRKAREKGLELLFDAAPALPRELVGDPLRLGQILTNLVSNAVKFTERGQVVVHLYEETRDSDSVTLRFEVTDTGIGMSETERQALFQAFSQVDSSTTRKFGGTGLGLSICKRLVEMMDGRIWVTSSPGAGSTFAFTARFGHGAAKGGSHRSLPAFLAGMHVLVADDNAAAREIRVQSLSVFNFRVDVVGNGLEAVDAVLRHDVSDPYRIVIVDWKMPGLDGIDTTRRIKGSDMLRSPPDVVMVTASASENLRCEAEAAGVDVFLTKPISQAVLENAILSLFPLGDASMPSRAAPAVERSYHDLRGRRVLLVEDNDVNQQIAVALLESQGIVVDVANNGSEAVARVTGGNHPYDAVLMDLQMPEMDGYEAASKLHIDQRFRDLPIIALTAHAMADERQRCLSAGMNDYVTKPLDPDVLFNTLQRWCGAQDQQVQHNPGNSEDSGGEPLLPVIPGLDILQGLKRVAGNQSLYKKLVTQFIATQTEAVRQMDELLDKGETDAAGKLAHTLAGAASNLGAKEIWRLAVELERSLRTPVQPKHLRQLNQALEHELAYLVWAERNAWQVSPDA